MKEQPIEFQTAKLAKEKGFKPQTAITYWSSNQCLNKKKGIANDVRYYFLLCEIKKWLRELYKINLDIRHEELENYSFACGKDYSDSIGGYQGYNTYEQALEAGLIEALKLI